MRNASTAAVRRVAFHYKPPAKSKSVSKSTSEEYRSSFENLFNEELQQKPFRTDRNELDEVICYVERFMSLLACDLLSFATASCAVPFSAELRYQHPPSLLYTTVPSAASRQYSSTKT